MAELLTRRQREVLRLIAAGQTERGAAQVLGIELSTVHQHVREIHLRLGTRSHAQAVAKAIRVGFI